MSEFALGALVGTAATWLGYLIGRYLLIYEITQHMRNMSEATDDESTEGTSE